MVLLLVQLPHFLLNRGCLRERPRTTQGFHAVPNTLTWATHKQLLCETCIHMVTAILLPVQGVD